MTMYSLRLQGIDLKEVEIPDDIMFRSEGGARSDDYV
jgi:hypothetical protein